MEWTSGPGRLSPESQHPGSRVPAPATPGPAPQAPGLDVGRVLTPANPTCGKQQNRAQAFLLRFPLRRAHSASHHSRLALAAPWLWGEDEGAFGIVSIERHGFKCRVCHQLHVTFSELAGFTCICKEERMTAQAAPSAPVRGGPGAEGRTDPLPSSLSSLLGPTGLWAAGAAPGAAEGDANDEASHSEGLTAVTLQGRPATSLLDHQLHSRARSERLRFKNDSRRPMASSLQPSVSPGHRLQLWL